MTLPHKDWTIWTFYICNRCFWDLEPNSGPDSVLYGWVCCYVQLCIALIEENRKGQVQQLVSWSCRKESGGFEPWNVQCTDALYHQFCSLWYASSLWQVKCLCDLIPVSVPCKNKLHFVATGERKCYIDTMYLEYIIK